MSTKSNDFFASVLYQSDYTLEDFKEAGITPENSSMKSKDEYKNMKAVQDIFTDQNTGVFDEKSFNQAYDQTLLLYNHYADNEQLIKAADSREYDPWDWWNNDPNKIQDVRPIMILGENPYMTTTSIVGMGLRTKPEYSMREIAQRQKIYDYDTGEFLEQTPNDYAGVLTPWKRWSMPSLVLATYDEDTEEEINGETVLHRKGELKFNDAGAPYYETLGNRPILGKDFLHSEDVRTVEGTMFNKLDWFDSDGIDKNPAGALMKDVSRVIPFILAGVLGGPTFAGYLGAISAAGALMEFMPTFLKSVDGFFTNDSMGNSFGRTMNDLEAYMKRREHSVSDKSRESIWTFENLSKMFGDVSLQLFQQRAIANIPQLLKIKSIADNPKIASALSFGFMATTSSQEAYDIFKQAGADDRTAALAMWSLMGIYYKLMSTDYYKHALFKDSWIDEKSLKTQITRIADDFADAVDAKKVPARPNTPEDAAKIVKWFNSALNWMTDPASQGAKRLFTASLAEGVEETMEEISIDALKGLAKGLEALGAPVGKDTLDFNWSLEDVVQRYGVSFLGGAFGGAVFHGYNMLDPNYRAAQLVSKTPEARIAELTHLISEGKKEELIETLSKLHKKGLLGSKDLSGTKIATVTGPEGLETQIFAGADKDMSVNDLVYNEIYKQIDLIDQILTEEKFKNQMENITAMLDSDETLASIPEQLRKSLASNTANLIRTDLERIASKMVDLRSSMKTIEGRLGGQKDSQKSKVDLDAALKEDGNYQDLAEQLKFYRDQRDAIYKKENISEYIAKAAFGIDNDLKTYLVGFSDLNSYTQFKYHKPLSEFNPVQQQLIKDEFEEFTSGENKSLLRAAKIYMDMSEEFQKLLMDKEALLSKITPDSTVNVETLGNEYLEDSKKKRELNKEIETIKQKKNPTSDDAEQLAKKQEELVKLNAKLDRIASTPEALTARLRATPIIAENIDEWAQQLLDEYALFVGKHKFNDDNLDLFLHTLSSRYNSEEIRRQIEKNIKERGEGLFNGNLAFDPDNDVARSETRSVLGYDENNPDDFFWDWEQETPIQREFFSLLDSYYTNLGKDNKAAVDAYNKIRALLKDRVKMTDEEIDDFLFSNFEEIVQVPGGQNTVNLGFSAIPRLYLSDGTPVTADELFERINEFKKNITYSQGIDLVKNFTIRTNSENLIRLINILEEQEKKLSGIRIEKFVLGNSIVRDQLNSLVSIINGISAIVTGSYNGFNEFINKYRSKEGKDPLAVLSVNTSKILINDLQNLKNRVNFILGLDELNSGQKLKEQKEIGVNMRLNFLKNLKLHVYIEDFNKKFFKDEDGKKLGKYESLEDLIVSVTPPNFDLYEINADNFAENEKYLIAIETALFDQIKNTSLSEEEILDNIVALYGHDALWKQRSTKLKSDTKPEEITDYDAAIYLASILTLHTNDFYVKYRDAIKNARQSDPNFNIVPVYGQEFAVKLIYSVLHNTTFFNNLVDKIAETYKGSDKYISEGKKYLYNMVTVLGGAGVGKTQGVGKIISLLLPEAEVRYICPSETQLQKLMAVDGDTEVAHGMTVDEWKNKFCPGIDSAKNIERKHFAFAIKKDTSTNDGWFSENAIKIIKIDEAAMNNSIVLEAISRFAQREGAIVVAMGDTKQTPAKIDNEFDGYEDCWYLSTPELTATFRAENTAKAENYQMLYNKLDKVHVNRKEDPSIGSGQVDTLLDTTPIMLSCGETETSIVGDAIVNTTESFEALLDKLIEKGVSSKDILVIGDDSTEKKYTTGKYKDKVTFLNAKDAQGGEYKYAFIDKTFGSKNFEALTDLYTFSQRGTTGSVILDTEKRFKSMNITSVPKSDAARPYEMSSEQREEFAKWRLDALEGLSYSENYEDNLRIGEKEGSEEFDRNDNDDDTKGDLSKGRSNNNTDNSEEGSEEPEGNRNTKNVVRKVNRTNTKSTTSITNPSETDSEADNAKPGENSGEEAEPERPVLEGFKMSSTTNQQEDDDFNRFNDPSEGYFESGEVITRIKSSGFITSEKKNEYSLYNFLKSHGAKITNDGQYRNQIQSIVTQVFSWKDGDSPKLKIDNASWNKVLENCDLTAHYSSKDQAITLHFTYKTDKKSVAVIPIAYVKGMKSGQFKSPVGLFEHVCRPTYERNGNEFITLDALEKKYPWLHINPKLGVPRGIAKDGDTESATTEEKIKARFGESGYDYYKRSSGKAMGFASSVLTQVNDATTLNEGKTEDGKDRNWFFSHEGRVRDFGVQRLIPKDEYEKVAKYCAAVHSLYHMNSEFDLIGVKQYGFSDRKDAISWLSTNINPEWSELNKKEKDRTISLTELDKKYRPFNSEAVKLITANLLSDALINVKSRTNVLVGIEITLKTPISIYENVPRMNGLLLQFNRDTQYLIAFDPETFGKNRKSLVLYRVNRVDDNKTECSRMNSVEYEDTNFNFNNALKQLIQKSILQDDLNEFGLTINDFTALNGRKACFAQIQLEGNQRDIRNVSERAGSGELYNFFRKDIKAFEDALGGSSFKNGVYGNIPIDQNQKELSGETTRWFLSAEKKGSYITNAVNWKSDVYRVKKDKINSLISSETDTNEKWTWLVEVNDTIDSIETSVNSLDTGIDFSEIISQARASAENTNFTDEASVVIFIDKLLTAINDQILSSTETVKTKLLRLDDRTFLPIIEHVDTRDQAELNLYNRVYGQQITKLSYINQSNTNLPANVRVAYHPIDVKQNDSDNQPYLLFYIDFDKKLTVKETTSFDSWSELKNTINSIRSSFKSDSEYNTLSSEEKAKERSKQGYYNMIQRYIDGILYDNATDSMITEYDVACKQLIKLGDDKVIAIQSAMETYMIDRLKSKYDEC